MTNELKGISWFINFHNITASINPSPIQLINLVIRRIGAIIAFNKEAKSAPPSDRSAHISFKSTNNKYNWSKATITVCCRVSPAAVI